MALDRRDNGLDCTTTDPAVLAKYRRGIPSPPEAMATAAGRDEGHATWRLLARLRAGGRDTPSSAHG